MIITLRYLYLLARRETHTTTGYDDDDDNDDDDDDDDDDNNVTDDDDGVTPTSTVLSAIQIRVLFCQIDSAFYILSVCPFIFLFQHGKSVHFPDAPII